jgi:putative DNA primase/helicase
VTNREQKVVEFPVHSESGPDEERARRLKVEVERLARLPLVEWMFYLDDVAKKHDVESAKLKAMVEAVIKETEKKAREEKAEDRQREQRAEKQQASARREQERQQREEKREQERADKEAKKRERERAKEFAAIFKLPKAEHEARLAALAKRLDEDLDFLRDEFVAFAETEDKSSSTIGDVEPWPEPVDTPVLLTELTTQLRRYIVMHDDAAIAVALWTMFAWIHEVAVHSPLLIFTSAEPDTGKTTACGVIKYLTPRAYSAAELTGPNLYRFVDHMRPTLIVDDADQLFERRPDLAHIVNVGWTRGTKIPRQGPGGVTHWFDPFCPKLIAGVKLALSKATASRTITVKLLPKLPHEKVEDFNHDDDDTFATLRRKLARWAADNAQALKDARPAMPFDRRLKMNWRFHLAIADLAGERFAKAARAAAVKLSRQRRELSEGIRLLTAFEMLFAKHGPILTSDEVQKHLTADEDSEWAEFRGRSAITKRQIALLLDPYDLHPAVVFHRGRNERGYKLDWFQDAFARYLKSPTASNRSTVRRVRING